METAFQINLNIYSTLIVSFRGTRKSRISEGLVTLLM